MELPQLQTAAASIASAPAFATAFSAQLNAFAAAAGALPGAFVPATPNYPALGASLAALLPLVGAGSKTATVQGIEAGFNAFYCRQDRGHHRGCARRRERVRPCLDCLAGQTFFELLRAV